MNNVVTVHGGDGSYCKEPCAQCPWRVDQTGKFPAKAFLLSANTSYDVAMETFACHMAGTEKPKTCAGFLLTGAADNLRVRMRRAAGEMVDVRVAGLKLHKSYKAMAVANGCDPDAPELQPCMPEARHEKVVRCKQKS